MHIILNFCLINSGCQDSRFECNGWARQGECSRNPTYMKSNCKKSCGLCSGKILLALALFSVEVVSVAVAVLASSSKARV